MVLSLKRDDIFLPTLIPIAYRSESPKPYGTSGLGLFRFAVDIFLVPNVGKSTATYQKTSLLWGESRE